MAYKMIDLGDKNFQVVSETGHIKLRLVGFQQEGSCIFRLDVGDKQIPVMADVESATTDDGQPYKIWSVDTGIVIVHDFSWYTPEERAELESQGYVMTQVIRECEYVPEEEVEEIYDALGEAMTAYWEARGQVVSEVRFPRRRGSG